MRISLSDAFDTHWIYVHRYMESSVNVVLRVRIDKRLPVEDIDIAVDALVSRHPYLMSRVCEEKTINDVSQFYLETIDEGSLSRNFNEVEGGEIEVVLNNVSQWRTHCFDLENGELAHVEVWRDKESTLIELTCAHLLTDVTGIMLLMSDLLGALDSDEALDELRTSSCQRLPFDEVRYDWKKEHEQSVALPLPEKLSPNAEKWPEVHFEYLRKEFSIEKFSKIKSFLSKNHIKAKVADFFYFILSLMYLREYGGSIQTNAILSFRHLLENDIDINSVNTLAVFSHVDIPDEKLSDPALWMKHFFEVRIGVIKQESIIEFMNFLRCLNLAMPGRDVIKGRQVLNTLLPVCSNDKVFVFNNYGVIDTFFDGLNRFGVTDVDVQDGVLAQEVRMFSFKQKIHFNMMFSPDALPFTTEEFWMQFNLYIDDVLGSLQ